MPDYEGQQIANIQAARAAQGKRPRRRVTLKRPPDTRAEARRLGAAQRARMALIQELVEELVVSQLERLQQSRQLGQDSDDLIPPPEIPPFIRGDLAQAAYDEGPLESYARRLDGIRYGLYLPPTNHRIVHDAAPQWADEVEQLIDTARRAYYQRRTRESLEEDARQAYASAEAANGAYLAEAYRRVLGVDLFEGGAAWISEELEASVKEHVDLIVSIESEQFDRIQRQVTHAVRRGWRVEELRGELHRTYEITRGRADLIARDQLSSWNGDLNRQRQTRVGIKAYVWRDSRDERVVGNPAGRYPTARSPRMHGNHWDRNGRVFLWEKAPDGSLVELLPDGSTKSTSYYDGHPGEAIQDRCTAEPVIPELEDIEAPSRAAERQTAANDPLAFLKPSLQGAGPVPNPPAKPRKTPLPRRRSGRSRGRRG